LKEDDEDFQSKTFYLKMKGDYYRYVAEVTVDDERKSTYLFYCNDVVVRQKPNVIHYLA